MKFPGMTMPVSILVAVASLVLLTPGSHGQVPLNLGEVASSSISMTPNSGPLYRDAPRPVDWRVQVEIQTEEAKLRPIKRIKAFFPKGMDFYPRADLPACPDALLGPPPVNISVPPNEMVSRCPNSVIGNGDAVIYIGKQYQELFARPSDLTMFYGGRNRQGVPRIKVHGWSAEFNTGTFMEGTWKDSVLDVEIPRLPVDSATGYFDLNIPGSNSPNPLRRGLDPSFVRTTCETGTWLGYSVFTLGERDNAGFPVGQEGVVRAPDFTTGCEGLPGVARAGLSAVSGPSKARAGGRQTFVVTLENRGTASARNLSVKATGRGVSGSARVGVVRAEGSNRVRITVSFARRGRVKAKFVLAGKGIRPRAVLKTVQVG